MIPRPFRLSVPRFSTSTRYGKSIVSWTLTTLILTSALTAAEQNQYVAGDYLVIDQQEALENGAGVRLTLRNASERTITAFSIFHEVGTSAGTVQRASSARDSYHLLPFREGGDGLPLKPGKTILVKIETPGIDLSSQRFSEGNYAVFSGRVAAVFFDNGEAVGEDPAYIRNFFDRRVAQVASTILVRDRLIELESLHGHGPGFLAAVQSLADQKTTVNPAHISNFGPRTPEAFREKMEQSGLNFALQHAENILTQSERIGLSEAFAFEIERLEIAISNGLQNIPRADREALQ